MYMKTISELSLITQKRIRFISIVFLLFIFSILFISEVKAQLAMSMQLNRDNYILYEQIYARVTFRNYSGRGIVFGKNPGLKGTLKFKIFTPGGILVKEREVENNLLEGIVLNPGATESVTVPLHGLYKLSKAGTYTINAIISHPQFKKSYKSVDNSFSIYNGLIVWEKIVGVPDVLNINKKEQIKTRKVKILNFYGDNKKLYALIIEDKKMVYGVVRLAESINSELPHCEIDGLSRIHILVQISAEVFSYFIYNVDCQLEEFTNYIQSDGVNPVLVRNPKQGTVTVVGGKKAVKGQDFTIESPNPDFIEE